MDSSGLKHCSGCSKKKKSEGFIDEKGLVHGTCNPCRERKNVSKLQF